MTYNKNLWSAKFGQKNILIGKKHLIGKSFGPKKIFGWKKSFSERNIWYKISFIGIQILERKHLLVPKKILLPSSASTQLNSTSTSTSIEAEIALFPFSDTPPSHPPNRKSSEMVYYFN